jgi:hypothetical protein
VKKLEQNKFNVKYDKKNVQIPSKKNLKKSTKRMIKKKSKKFFVFSVIV